MANNTVLAKLAVLISANNIQFNSQLKQSSKQLQDFSDSVRNTFAGVGVAFGISKIIDAVKSVVNVAAEFEATMSEVRAITGATGREFDALSQDALRLGASTKFTSSQVGQLQVAYGRLGFSTKEILNATEATLQLAAATGEDLAKSADVAGSTVRGFGLNANQTQRVVDVMAASFNKTALGLENFTESMKYVAPIAAAANVSVEETTALLGVLADNGIRGSSAGTSLRKIFTDLAKDGRPLRERLDELGKKGITLTDAFDEVGRTAQTSLLILSKNTDRVNELTTAFGNVAGEAERVARIMQDNLQGDIEKLSSAWEGLILKISNTDAFRRAANGLTGLLNAAQGGSLVDLNDALNSTAELISKGADAMSAEAEVLRKELASLRKEAGKPIDLSYVEDLARKYKLTDEQANNLYAVIYDVNKQLSFQEKVISDFKRSNPAQTYDDLSIAVDKYKEGIYNQILQSQILIAQLEKENALYGKVTPVIVDANKKEIEAAKQSIQSYRRKIEILNEYAEVNKKSVKSTTDAVVVTKTYANTLAGFNEKLKDVNEEYANINLNDQKRLYNAAAEIVSLQKRIEKIQELTKMLAKPLSLQIRSTQIGAAPGDRESNTAGQDLLNSIDYVEKAKQTFSISPEMKSRFEDGLKELQAATSHSTEAIGGQWIDLSGIIGGAISDIAEGFGGAIAGTQNFGESIIKAVTNFAKQFGEILIATGTAALAAKLLIKNPYTAIAAGVALVAIAGAASARLNSAQSNFNSGSSASTSASSSDALTSSSSSIQDQRISGTVIIKGKDLWLALSNYEQNSKSTKVTNG